MAEPDLGMKDRAWAEVTVDTSTEAVEAVANILMETGADGVVIEDSTLLPPETDHNGLPEWSELREKASRRTKSRVKAYLPVDTALSDKVAEIKRRVGILPGIGLDAGPGTVSIKTVTEKNWAHAWKAYYHPQRVGRHLVIKPSWETYEGQAGDVVVELDPGMAFGTGDHPTTRLCLEQLEKRVTPADTVFDVGTGSGILAVAAAKLGAAAVWGCDPDPVAVQVAIDNVKRNGVEEKVKVVPGTIECLQGSADIIVANIITDTIVAITPAAVERLAGGGYFVASGIIAARQDEVKAAFQQAHLQLVEVAEEAEWVCLVGRE